MDIVKLCNLIDTLDVSDSEKYYTKLILIRSLEGHLLGHYLGEEYGIKPHYIGYEYKIKGMCIGNYDLIKALNIYKSTCSDSVYLGEGDWGRKEETSGSCPASLFTTDTEEDVMLKLRKNNIFKKK